jgi:hypothetical protein
VPADFTTDRLLALASWEWQDVDKLMELLLPTVPAGKATRTYAARQGRRSKGTGNRPPLTDLEKVRSGARAIVNDRIGSQVDGGRIELRRDEEGRRQIRFADRRRESTKPGTCPACGHDPFRNATMEAPPRPSPLEQRPESKNVSYPRFPQWDRTLRPGSSR